MVVCPECGMGMVLKGEGAECPDCGLTVERMIRAGKLVLGELDDRELVELIRAGKVRARVRGMRREFELDVALRVEAGKVFRPEPLLGCRAA